MKDVGYVLTALRSTYQFIQATFLTSLDSVNVPQPLPDLYFIGNARNKYLTSHSHVYYSIAYEYRPLQHLKTTIKSLLKTKLLVARVVLSRVLIGMILLARVPVAWEAAYTGNCNADHDPTESGATGNTAADN